MKKRHPKWTEKDRQLIMSIPIDELKRGLHDSVSLSIPLSSESEPHAHSNPYSEIDKWDMDNLIERTRKQLICGIQGMGIQYSRNLRVYITLFDLLVEGQPIMYASLARRLGMSRQRLELLRDGLLRFKVMQDLRKVLHAAVSDSI